MGKTQDPEPRERELSETGRRAFEESRIIDVSDQQAMRFWSQRLGVTEAEIVEVIQLVGPNSTAVALKLEAPQEERVSPPISPR